MSRGCPFDKLSRQNAVLYPKQTWHTYMGCGTGGGGLALLRILGGLGGIGGGDGDTWRGRIVGAAGGSRSITCELSGDISSGKKSNAVNTSCNINKRKY